MRSQPIKRKEPRRPKELKKLIGDNLEYFGRFYMDMIMASGLLRKGTERREKVQEILNEFLRGTCLSKYQ
jgi:hypothetical protein